MVTIEFGTITNGGSAASDSNADTSRHGTFSAKKNDFKAPSNEHEGNDALKKEIDEKMSNYYIDNGGRAGSYHNINGSSINRNKMLGITQHNGGSNYGTTYSEAMHHENGVHGNNPGKIAPF